MALPLKPNRPPGLSSWGWPSGLLVLLASLGLHGVLLLWPIPDPAAPEPEVILPQADDTEAIAVVRLPPTAVEPAPEPPAPEPVSPTSPAPVPPAPAIPPQVQAESPQAPPTIPQAEPTPPVEPEPDTLATQTPPLTLAERLQTPAEYQFNHQPKALTASTGDFLTWYGEQDWGSDPALTPLPGPKALSPLIVPYPLETCLTPPPAPGRLEVIVNPDGSLLRDPSLLGSTGYDVLDTAALEAVKEYDFSLIADPNQPSPKVYWLPVEVRSTAANCPEL